MGHQKHNGRSSNPHRIPKHDELEDVQEQHEQPLPFRPKSDNRDEWRIYWQAKGWSWRTEPEISKERQEELARRRAIPVDIEKGIYPFGGMKLDRADVEWLLATHENGRGPVVWSDERQRNRQGLDLRGANLRKIDLRGLPMAKVYAGLPYFKKHFYTLEQLKHAGACLEESDLREAHMEAGVLRGAHLENADLRGTFLENADLSRTHLEGANCRGANFSRAIIVNTHLEGADLPDAYMREAKLIRAHLEGVHLRGANLEDADLRRAFFDTATNLDGTIISNSRGDCFLLAGIHWGDVDLTMLNWSRVILLGEERLTQQNEKDGEKKTNETRLFEYQEATRANRQLAVALQEQGLNEDAVRFAYRANVLQRRVYWYQTFDIKTRQREKELIKWNEELRRRFVTLRQRLQGFASYSFSLFLDILAGYGYKPERTVGWYLLVVFGFALAYALFGHLPFWPDALVYSLTSFHGRGFLPNLDGQTATLHNPLVVMAAFEAVIGLLIEVSFIATFTQRFFGK